MGNGSPALHFQLAGAAVLLAALTLAFAAPARAETPVPGAVAEALASAPVAPTADAVATATATATVPTVEVVTAPAAPVAPAVAAAKSAVEAVPAPVRVAEPTVARIVRRAAAVVAPAVQMSRPLATRLAVTHPSPSARPPSFAPQHPARHADRLRADQLRAIGSPNAAAALFSLDTQIRVVAVSRPTAGQQGTRTPSRAANAPKPGRSADASAGGAGLGTAPAGAASLLVATAVRVLALARRDALFRVPASAARPHSYRFLLELERPG